jgi:hypothetical protein
MREPKTAIFLHSCRSRLRREGISALLKMTVLLGRIAAQREREFYVLGASLQNLKMLAVI